jgi:nicotinate-nucleotide adenylyltransferase
MLAASIAGDPRLSLDDCEIRRQGVSYTVDTLEDIIERYSPEGKPGLIIGDDLAAEFPKWHESEKILEMADLIIARRTGTGEAKYPFANMQIANEIMNVSSQMIRENIQSGKAWRALVPADARAIIEDRRLYGFADGANRKHEKSEAVLPEAEDTDKTVSKQLILGIEEAVRSRLDFNRFIHSRNTALFAWDFCLRFGQDPRLGYFAGIAHDIGKHLEIDEMKKLAKTDGLGLSDLEKKKPQLLHGRAGAALLKERYNVNNSQVLEAVAWHTSGKTDMGPIAKIVYIADKIEVSRRHIDPDLRSMCLKGNDLDLIFQSVLKNTVFWLQKYKLDLSVETALLLEKMKGKSIGDEKI